MVSLPTIKSYEDAVVGSDVDVLVVLGVVVGVIVGEDVCLPLPPPP